MRRFSFVGPFVGNPESGDFKVAFAVLTKLGVLEKDMAGAYHSHPPSSWARFSLGDMATAVTFQKPTYIVGTNTAGDGEVVRFTPNITPLPQGWQSGPAQGSVIDEVLYNWLAWGAIREAVYDWTTPPLGDVVTLGDLGSTGELLDHARQCPAQVY